MSAKFQYCVGRVSVDQNHLSQWQKLIFNYVYKPFARFCHFRLGLPTTSQLVSSVECKHCGQRTALPYKGFRNELQSICTNKSTASAMVAAGGEGWFDHELPVDATLPKNNVVLRGARFGTEGKDRNFDGNNPIVIICPITREVCKEHESLKRSDVENLYRKVKTAVAS